MTNQKAHLTISLLLFDKEENISLDGREFIFGRSVKSDVNIKDPSFSRSHFKIFIQDTSLWITDLDSSNGTYIDNIKISSDTSTPIKLNDVISIDSTATKITIKKIEFYDVNQQDHSEIIEHETTSITRKPQDAKIREHKSQDQKAKDPRPNEFKSKDDLSSLMNRILLDANSKAEQIIIQAEDTSLKIKKNIENECQVLISKTQHEAIAITEMAKQNAVLAFTENLKNKIAKDLEEESKKIKQDHLNEKENLRKSLKEYEETLSQKIIELSGLDQDVFLKKEKLFTELVLDFSAKQQEFKKT